MCNRPVILTLQEEQMKQKRLVALLLVVAMLFTFVSVIAACKPQDECEKNGHKLTAVDKKDATLQEAGYEAYWKCDVCGKLFSDSEGKNEISKPVVIDKLTPHVCGHVCPTCGKCLDETCTDPVCAEKCAGHEVAPSKEGVFTPITEPVAGQYYMGMKCSGDVYYYLKGGMAQYYMATSNNKEDAVVVTLVEDGDGWLLKQGEKYMEIEISGTHVNAVYKDAQTAGKHWSWDETYKIFTWENGTYFYGTYGTYNTIGGGEYATHAADNYKAQLGLFVPETVGEVESVSIMNGTVDNTGATTYLLPIEGNAISFSAKVNPSNAPQDIVWTVENGDIATVTTNDTTEETMATAKVTYKGQTGTITLKATAKDTNISATITVEIRDVKGSKEDNPLTVDEAIALMDETPNVYLSADSQHHGFYIQGIVATGSKPTSAGWSFTLAGSDDKGINCSVVSSKLNGISIPNIDGGLDNCEVLFYAYTLYKNEGYSSSGNMTELKTCIFPDLEAIEIEATQTEVTVLYSVEVTVKSITPANAVFENVEWLTSDETKATVTGDTKKATVTTIAAGEVKISVKCENVTSNEITLTVSDGQSNSIIYDWSGNLTENSIVDNIYTYDSVSNMLTKLNTWSPEQQEITAFTASNLSISKNGQGFGYFALPAVDNSATATFTTTHQIKKITFRIIPFADATTTEFTVNGVSFKKDKEDATYNGKLSSAFNAEVELTEASNILEIQMPWKQKNNFVIVGMTLEPESTGTNQLSLDWSGNLTENSIVDNIYTYDSVSNMLTKLNTWSPEQQEITAFTASNLSISKNGQGFGYFALPAVDNSATATFTTVHQIKKITFRIIPFADATTTEFTVNGVSFKKDKEDATYNGKLGSAFDAEVELTEASNILEIQMPWKQKNNFVIVGVTFEW